MGRNKLPEQRELVSTRLPQALKKALDLVKEKRKFRNVSHAVEVLIEEHPDIQAAKNGKARHK